MYSILLSGPPGCGKSTYVKNYLPATFRYLSTDRLILNECERVGKSYDEVFPDYMKKAHLLFEEQLQVCNQKRNSLIIDQTNLTESARKRKLRMISKDAVKVAIYFPAYTPDLLFKRVSERVSSGGHKVPLEIIEKMHKDYKIPQKTEGFDLVVSSAQFIDILKVMDFK